MVARFSLFLLCLTLTALALSQGTWVRMPESVKTRFAEGRVKSSPPTVWEWIRGQITNRIEVSGQRRLGYHNHVVEGDREAYNSLAPFGQGGRRFTDLGQMNVSGRNVLGLLNFQFAFTDSTYRDPQGQRFSVDYVRGPWAINVGDINGTLLNTNPYAPYSNTIRGAQVGYAKGRFAIRAVRSETRASSKTISFQGANSTGPYYLQSSQVIRDSIKVLVDGQEQILGTDFIVDYEFGSITFLTRVVAATSTIIVSFESLNFNVSPGIVQGIGAAYDFGRIGRLGVSTIQLESRSGSGLSERVERFQGFGPPSTPYVLQFEPLESRPVTVRVDGVIQVRGVDFLFDSNNPAIFYMRRFVPSTSTVEVRYTPKPTSLIDGDRRVVAWDWRIPLGGGEQNFVQYSQADGRLSSTATPLRGMARGVEARFTIPTRGGSSRPRRDITDPLRPSAPPVKIPVQGGSVAPAGWSGNELGLSLYGKLSDVPSGYTTVESRGFNRNERSAEMGAEWRTRTMTLGLSHRNSSIANRVTGNDGIVRFDPARAVLSRGYLQSRPGEDGGWTLEHNRSFSRASGQQTRIDSSILSTQKGYAKNRLRVGFGLERQDGRGPIQRESGSQVGRLTLETLKSTLTFLPSRDWTLVGRVSASQIRSLGDRGTGEDFGVTASYRPERGRLILDASYRVSNGGQLAALGSLDNGFGLGFDGNGFNGGAIGTPLSSVGSDLRLAQIAASYRLNHRVLLDGQAYQSRSSGGISSNSETVGGSFNLNVDLGLNHAFLFGVSSNRTTFLSGEDESSATNINAIFEAAPPGPWSYGLGMSWLLSPGGSAFAQNSNSLDTYLRYRINRDQNLRMSYSRRNSTGYLPQDEWSAVVAYEYRIYRNIALIGSYTLRRLSNRDAAATTGAYRSRGFDLELSFNFGY